MKFFRKIRQRLLTENRFGKYLLYAIGEIVIVLIGILIAIQINNWNERRINEKKIVSFLQEIKKNLADEIEKSESVIEIYNRKDSLIQKVLDNKITRQDFKVENNAPQYTIMNWGKIDINRNAYNNLILISSEISSKYESLYEDLNTLYVTDGEYLDWRKSKLEEKIQDFENYLADNKAWYSSLFLEEKINEKAIDYFMEDAIYKNHVLEYYDDALKLWDAIIDYKEQAELVCEKITELEQK